MLISLLDLVLQNQMPQGGLLGGGAPPEANPLAALAGAQQGPDRVEGVSSSYRRGRRRPSRIPVNADALLTEGDREALTQRRLFTTGLGILAADPSASSFQRIAEGALLGEELSREAKQDLIEQRIDLQELAIDLREEQQETAKDLQVREIFSNADLSDPQQRTQVMQQLLQGGAFKAAQRLNSFEANLPEAKGVENGGEIILYDPRTLEIKGRIQTPDERPEGTELINRGTFSELIDSNTGETIRRFSHELSPEELREVQDTIFDRTDKLADDFRSETGNLQQSVALGRDALDAPRDDPAAQQTLVIALNKLLDPGSVVRQSEFARVQEIGGFKSEAQTFANRLAREGQLPPEVEDTLRAEIARLSETNKARLQEIASQYKERAQTFGVNPEFIVRQGLIEDEPEEVENPFEGI